MAAPVLQYTSPADGEVDLAVGVKPQAVFDVAVDRDSINTATIMLFRSDDLEPVQVSFVFSNGDKTVTLMPSSVLAEDTAYKLKIIGADLGTGSAIKSITGNFLSTTTTVSFRVGTERFVPLAEAVQRDDLESLGPIREGDDLAVQPTGGALEIDRRTPKAFAKTLITATGLNINFDQEISASTVTTTTVEVEQFPVWGMTQYFASVPSGQTDPKLATQQDNSLSPPAGTLAVEGDAIYWNLDPDDDFLYNTEVVVTITKDVESTTGATLTETEEYFFTTEYFPLFFDPRQLRLALGPAVSSLHDDTLCRIIHKNSIEAWELSGRSISLTDPPYRYVKWVRCQSVLDIISTLLQSRDFAAGQTKTLGDFTVRNTPSDPELNAKYAMAKECVNDLPLGPTDGTLVAVAAVKGRQAPGERFDHKLRTWDHLLFQATPGANLTTERGEKQRLSTNYAFDNKDTTFNNTFFIRTIPSTVI